MDNVITYKKMKTVKILRLIGEKPIGKGSYGVVWKAVDDDFGIVATKLQKVLNEKEIESLITEFYISKGNSPYIIKIKYLIFDRKYIGLKKYFEDIISFTDLPDGLSFISIYDLANGFGLDKLIDISFESKVPFSRQTYQKYCIDLLNGLLEFRKLGIAHRDIKPANIMLSDGLLKYIDFGGSCKIAKCVGLVGTTPNFASPALLIKKGNLTEEEWYENDMFSLGATMLKMAYDKVPYDYIPNVNIYGSLISALKSQPKNHLDAFIENRIVHELESSGYPQYIPIIFGLMRSSNKITIEEAIKMITDIE